MCLYFAFKKEFYIWNYAKHLIKMILFLKNHNTQRLMHIVILVDCLFWMIHAFSMWQASKQKP